MCVGDTISVPYSVTAGVPPGSNLGLVLFLVFIDDLTIYIGNAVGTELLADDTVIHCECEPSRVLGGQN